jgi:hypothetical protein
MTGSDTGFSQPIKFQEISTTTQHQSGTQVYPLYNYNREIEVGPWREGPSSMTTTMTGPDTGFPQPIKFQVMGATAQHQY